MNRQRVLVIDDELNMREMLKAMLGRHDYNSVLAESAESALDLLSSEQFDYILCDVKMPRIDGAAFLAEAIKMGISSPVIMMSAYGTTDLAIECMKLGAYDFISKPFRSDEIMLVLKKAEEREKLKKENLMLRLQMQKEFSFGSMISQSRKMKEIFSLISKVCDYKTTVLIQGESGTGKELVARALHYSSIRKNSPFIAVNCGAIPENLLESELFGHVKGAFTDALKDKPGLFEQADGGTIFLDEIGEMPLSLQVKLLRVIQDEEIRRLGAGSSKKVDVRVVSATARNLEEDVKTGRFREDLFFRLNVFTIKIPPLRERMEDIPLLVSHFISKYAATFSKKAPFCGKRAMAVLLGNKWSGNVRELENVIERAMVLCDGEEILPSHLPEFLSEGAAGENLLWGDTLSIKKGQEMMERSLIAKALELTGGNRSKASELLEISYRSLLYKIAEYGFSER